MLKGFPISSPGDQNPNHGLGEIYSLNTCPDESTENASSTTGLFPPHSEIQGFFLYPFRFTTY